MLNHLFISIFSLILSAVLFVSPLLLAENFLVDAFSSQASQIEQVNQSLRFSSPDRNILYVGDSTIRRLNQDLESLYLNPKVMNVSAGGAGSSEWYFLTRNALQANPNIATILVGAANPFGFKSNNNLNPYYPFILNYYDVYDLYKSKRLTFVQAITLTHFIFAKIFFSKDEILTKIGSHLLPFMKSFFTKMYLSEFSGSNYNAGAKGGARSIEDEDLNKIVSLRKGKAEIKYIFVTVPVRSDIRESNLYAEGYKFFSNYCLRFQRSCHNYSSRFPDTYFTEDGVHLKKEFEQSLAQLLMEAVKK